MRSGDWLVTRVRGFARDVGSVVPHGFEGYARVFHPVEDGPERRWSALAARNGRVVHAEMQFHLISRPRGEAPVGYEPLDGMSVGSLPRHELQTLAALMARHTTTPASCRFAVWDGYSQLHGSPAARRLAPPGMRTEPVAPLVPPEVLRAPRLELPSRAYVLLHGAVVDATGVFDLLEAQSPNLWWPDDHAWCVATEIDLGWTYVAGTEDAIVDVLATPELETLAASVTDGVTYDSDRVNAELDDA